MAGAYGGNREDELLKYLRITNKRMDIIQTKLNDTQQALKSAKETHENTQMLRPDENYCKGQEQAFFNSQEYSRRQRHYEKKYKAAQNLDESLRHTPLLKPDEDYCKGQEQQYVNSREYSRRADQLRKKYGE